MVILIGVKDLLQLESTLLKYVWSHFNQFQPISFIYYHEPISWNFLIHSFFYRHSQVVIPKQTMNFT